MYRNLLYKLRTSFLLSKSTKQYKILFSKKKDQIEMFNNLEKEFKNLYLKVSKADDKPFILKAWEEKNKSLIDEFLPYPPIFFLRHPMILSTMFVASGGKWLDVQSKFLEKNISEKKLKDILEEDYVGGPILLNSKYLTSHNSVHHLYHIQKFINDTGYKFKNNDVIVEWGGGYGNLAKIINRLAKNKNLTYIIIDSSLFSSIQWLYLSCVLDKNKVFIITKRQDKIKKGYINILPLGFLDAQNIRANLFISTWALSESSEYSQKYVLKKNWFEAKSILLSFQKSSKSFPYAQSLEEKLKEKGGVIKEIPFLPNNYYGFLHKN